MPKEKATPTRSRTRKAVTPTKSQSSTKKSTRKVAKKTAPKPALKPASKPKAKKAVRASAKKTATSTTSLPASTTRKRAAASPIPAPKLSSKDMTVAEMAAHAEAAPKPVTNARGRRVTNYLNNADMLKAVIESKAAGKMNDTLARMLMMLVERYATRGNFVGYCVDEETTALTKDGWKTIDTISTDDKVLSLDPSTGKLVWSDILEVYRGTYVGPMHRLTTQGMDALVTPGHKFVSAEHGLIPVEDITTTDHIVLMGSPVDHDEILYTDAAVQVIGWAIAEGHYSTRSKRKHSITIYQRPGAKADLIEQALLSAGVHFKRYETRGLSAFNCSGQLISDIHQRIAPERVLSPEFITSLDQRQRMLLISTMVAGDGWYRPTGGMSYVQKCERHVDAFLMLCTIAGLNTSVTRRTYATPPSNKHPTGGSSTVFSVNVFARPKTTCRAEWINFHGGRPGPGGRHSDKPNVPTHPYDGRVWCPRTEYGTFVCRRGKYIHVTGNTYNDEMRGYAIVALMKTWASFNEKKSQNPFAYYTQCIKNNFIHYLKVEKKHQITRDKLMIDAGYMPSYSYQMQHSESHHDYSDHDADHDEGFTPQGSRHLSQLADEHFDSVEGSDSVEDTEAWEDSSPRYRFDDIHLVSEFGDDVPDDIDPLEDIEP